MILSAKSWMTVVFFSLFCFLAQAQQIEVKANRLHGLLVFAFSNAGFPGYSPFLKEYAANSKYKSEIDQILLGMEGLERSLSQRVSFHEEVQGYGDGFSVQDLAETQSAYAKDIDDLMVRLQATMPVQDWVKFRKILRALDPIYEDLIWSQSQRDIEAAEKLYKQKIKEWKLAELFSQAKIFYKSEWPEDLKFTIALYPIPKGARHSNAHSLGPFESVGVILGEKNIAGRFGVIFHEMMHSLYSAQDLQFKKELYSWFALDVKDSDFPYRSGTQRFANEIFATVLGNGWSYEVITGQPDTSSWYAEPHIEGVSRGIYDLTKNYLKNKKPVDQEFVKAMIAKFKELFPAFPDSADYLFSDIEIQHTGKVFRSLEIRKAVRSRIRSSKLGISSDSDLLKSFKPSVESGITMILLTNEEAKNLNSKQANTLGLPKEIIPLLKKDISGMWKWKDRKGRIRLLSVGKSDGLRDLFAGSIHSI